MSKYDPEDLGERPKDFGLGAGMASDEKKLRNEIQFIKHGIVDLRDDNVKITKSLSDLSKIILKLNEERSALLFWLRLVIGAFAVTIVWLLLKK
jgi:hypothetical protein